MWFCYYIFKIKCILLLESPCSLVRSLVRWLVRPFFSVQRATENIVVNVNWVKVQTHGENRASFIVRWKHRMLQDIHTCMYILQHSICIWTKPSPEKIVLNTSKLSLLMERWLLLHLICLFINVKYNPVFPITAYLWHCYTKHHPLPHQYSEACPGKYIKCTPASDCYCYSSIQMWIYKKITFKCEHIKFKM